MALAKKKAAEASNAKSAMRLSRYLDQCRAYWRGERDDLPAKPA